VTPRADRVLLALEVALGVVPVTIFGGVVAVLGAFVGSASLGIMIAQRTWDGASIWLVVLALAAGGLAGIVGLWATVLVTIAKPPPDRRLVRAAVSGSAIGVATAVAALRLLFQNPSGGAPRFVAMLAAATAVAVHRVPRIVKHHWR
jgi:hypothetical protein